MGNQKNDTRKAERSIEVEFKLAQVTKAGDGELFIEGYANTKMKDRVGDVVLPGAFAKSLPTYQENPILLYQHNWDAPIGTVTECKIDDNGLWIKAKISAAADCADVRTKILEGVLRTFSIGFNPVTTKFNEAEKINYIEELELLEISVVSIPANTGSKFKPVIAQAEEAAGKAAALAERAGRIASEATALLESVKNMSKGEPMPNENTQTTTTPPAPASTTAAPAEPPKDQMAKMDEIQKGVQGCHEAVKGCHEAVKGCHEEVKALKAMVEKMKPGEGYPYPKPCEGDEGGKTAPKPAAELSDEEASAELEQISTELEGLQKV